MRALVAIGIFTEPEPGLYAHTLQSETLRQAEHRAVIQGMCVIQSMPGGPFNVSFTSLIDRYQGRDCHADDGASRLPRGPQVAGPG